LGAVKVDVALGNLMGRTEPCNAHRVKCHRGRGEVHQ
jgi:hypothetical protein